MTPPGRVPLAERPFHLYMFRHGATQESDPARWPSDLSRPLSADGAAQTRAAARGFVSLTGPVDRIATSPARRCKTTAKLVASAYVRAPRIETWEALGIGRPPIDALERLAHRPARADRRVLVGHAPGLAGLIKAALSSDAVGIVHLTRSGGCALDFPRGMRPGGGRLDWLLTRNQLCAPPE